MKKKVTLQKKILNIFQSEIKKTYNYKQIAGILKENNAEDRKLIYSILLDMSDQGLLKEVSKGKFKSAQNPQILEGRIEITKRGAGYVISDAGDVFIAPKSINRALHGDLVKVHVFKSRGKKSREGEVLEILERANKTIVGTIELNEKFAFLVPDNYKIDIDIFIPLSKLNGAKAGYKAIAKLLEWPESAKNPFGEIIEVLGRPESNDAEMKAILAANGIPSVFPEAVLAEAAAISTLIPETEISKRKDLRDILTFTIDPTDARDFDDAISFRKLTNGHVEIGVHIADVGHYVTPNSALDKEAYTRGNSVYLVDRVIPMLPERLSNGVCSLRPNEEKLTFSAIFEMDDQAAIHNEWFGKTVINSNHRFTYEDAQNIIETGKGEHSEALLAVDKLAKILRKARLKNGALEIQSEELRFELNEEGVPINTYKKRTKDANKLVEEFMLMANKKVAKFVGDTQKRKTVIPFIYRVHDKPDKEKVELFSVFLQKFDKAFTYKNDRDIALKMNELFEELKDEPSFSMIQSMAIRTMAKAVYDTENIGHYGLGFRYYTHFTSPIRRYADLLVHRILLETLEKQNKQHPGLTDTALHISQTERRAVNAERDSQKFFQAFYVKDRIGESFNGVITGITDWGMYVEMTDLNCEGMVQIKSIQDDKYYFDEKKYAVVGLKYGEEFNVGDRLIVIIEKVSLTRKQIDLKLMQ
ncbi:MAG: ribonuclease R [Putridiphycobacter sp.]|nr:ribonuclease R [Putridiphycobacter sp.]